MIRLGPGRLAGALVTLLLGGFAALAQAQAVLDNETSTTAVFTSAAPTKALAYHTGAANNRMLLVSIGMNIGDATGTTVASVTYGGLPLVKVNAVNDASLDTRTEVWQRPAPSIGTSNIVVTATGITPGASVKAVVSATTFRGVDQSAPPSAASTGTGSSATVGIGSASLDTIIAFVSARETVTLTPAATQTEGFDVSTGGTSSDLQAASARRSATVPTTTMSWSLSVSRRWTIVAVNLRRALADVEVTQSATPDPVEPAGELTYRFGIRNRGLNTAEGVVLTDVLPASTTHLVTSTTRGSCSGVFTVSCLIGTLAAGELAVVTIRVAAPITPGPTAPNTGLVTTATPDPGSPNTASASSTVLAPSLVCAPRPGKDGVGISLSGVVNAYWPGTASVAAGGMAITLGIRRGAPVSITAGDLVLVIQMQDAQIASDNDDRYGSGAGIVGGTLAPGAGVTSANDSGRYEYAIATNTVGAGGGTLTLSAGLLFTYTDASVTPIRAQRRFQVVRVPQYSSATLGSPLASAWNGRTGGVLALDVAGTLNLGGATVSVDGQGFRGGLGQPRGGGIASSDDYRSEAASDAHGVKGEGIAGTPEFVVDEGVAFDTGSQGYPAGDYGRGAPGNAGGGGTDGNPSANDQNSGGGGGANGGDGGRGGNTWFSNLARGGFGGAAFAGSPGRVVLGGGGGAGTRNSDTGLQSSGGAGGGIVLIRAGALTDAGTITANGADAFNGTAGHGGGGGGAGGSIVVISRQGGLAGLTLSARGGRGGDAWRTQSPAGNPGERHGPGGGGGGGFIATSAPPVEAPVSGGAPGLTTTANDAFGAKAGDPGVALSTASFREVAGPATACEAAFLPMLVTKTFDPPAVEQNEPSVLTITLGNPNALTAISGIGFVDFYPSGLRNHLSPNAVTDCQGSLTAPAGGVLLILSGGALAANAQCTVSVNVVSDVDGTYTNRLPAGAVTTANAGPTTVPVSAALVVFPLNQKADPTRPDVFKSFSPEVVKLGAAATLSIVVFNGTPTTFTGLTFVDAYPPGLTNAPAPGVTNTCGGTIFASPGGSSLSLSGGTVAAQSSCTITAAVTGAPAGTYTNVIEAGTVQVIEALPNPSPATASVVVSALAPPTVVKVFVPPSARPGEPSRLTIRVVNPNPTPLTDVVLVDRFPAGLRLAASPDAASTCGGDLLAFPGGSRVLVGGATVPASGECAVSVTVAAADWARGALTNTIAAGAIVSANAPASEAAASADLVVEPVVVSGGSPTPIPIPVLSPVGLGVLAALLAGLAAFRMRVQR